MARRLRLVLTSEGESWYLCFQIRFWILSLTPNLMIPSFLCDSKRCSNLSPRLNVAHLCCFTLKTLPLPKLPEPRVAADKRYTLASDRCFGSPSIVGRVRMQVALGGGSISTSEIRAA